MLTEAIFLKYGYDFRDYARASLKRRVLRCVERHGMAHLSDLIHAVLHDEDVFFALLADLSVTVTEMFRDAEFFRALRMDVLPSLSAQEHIRIEEFLVTLRQCNRDVPAQELRSPQIPKKSQ